MELESYLARNESATKKVEAFESAEAISDNRKGMLACTPNRVVYVQGDDVIDISLNGVDSIEYSAPSYPSKYLYLGGGFCLLALLGIVVDYVAESLPDLMPFAVVLAVTGIGILGVGLFLKRSTIKFRTPNTTYEFASKDGTLKDIAHALRGHE